MVPNTMNPVMFSLFEFCQLYIYMQLVMYVRKSSDDVTVAATIKALEDITKSSVEGYIEEKREQIDHDIKDQDEDQGQDEDVQDKNEDQDQLLQEEDETGGEYKIFKVSISQHAFLSLSRMSKVFHKGQS